MNPVNIAGERGRKWTPQTDPPRRIGAKNDASLAPTRENAKDRNIFNRKVPNAQPRGNKPVASHNSPTTALHVSAVLPQVATVDERRGTAGIPGVLIDAPSRRPIDGAAREDAPRSIGTCRPKGVAHGE